MSSENIRLRMEIILKQSLCHSIKLQALRGRSKSIQTKDTKSHGQKSKCYIDARGVLVLRQELIVIYRPVSLLRWSTP
jgi:hypothetical protein